MRRRRPKRHQRRKPRLGEGLEKALAILHRDAPYTFLYWRDRLVGLSAEVIGAEPNAQSSLFNLDEWQVATADGDI